jgi:hypothetical protein
MGVDEDIDEAVRVHGWQFINIYDHEPPFLYSIGLMPEHAEIIVFGLERDEAAAVLGEICERIKQGEVFEHKTVHDINAPIPHIAVRSVHPTQIQLYFGYAMGYCRLKRLGEVRALQVFWPDKQGKFPFDADCGQETYQRQTRLDIGLTPREVAAWERQWE